MILTGASVSSQNTVNMKEAKIKTSAVCGMCKTRIEKALNKTEGVETAILDLDSKYVTVKYNADKTDLDKIRKAISDVGYDADDIKADVQACKKLPDCCKSKKTNKTCH